MSMIHLQISQQEILFQDQGITLYNDDDHDSFQVLYLQIRNQDHLENSLDK